jgi:hypothetical protein
MPVPTKTATAALTSTSTPETASPATGTTSDFPSGKFLDPNDPHLYFMFSKSGRWGHYFEGTRLAGGRFSVAGDIDIQESNSGGCPVPMDFKYTFDGTNLTFQLTPQSQLDTCGDRRDLYDNKTYILSP